MTYVGGEVQGKEVGMGKVAGVREAEGSLQGPCIIRVRRRKMRSNDDRQRNGQQGRGL